MQQLTIVIPVYNDAAALAQLLPALPDAAEVIVVDGGSSDLAERQWPAGVRWLHVPEPSRGAQLLAGCEAATGSWLWLLHADSSFESALIDQLRAVEEPCWGRFDVALRSDQRLLALVAALMNLRSRWTSVCTGDQGIFVHRDLLNSVHGVPSQPLMEDIELSRRLRRLATARCLPGKLRTSARRWEQHGVLRTIVTMWWLRLRYRFGSTPEQLAASYYS